jgi:hypothetical protein
MESGSFLARYKPQAQHITLSTFEGGKKWGVIFSPRANVCDVAVVIAGLGIECVVEPCKLTAGFVVIPADPAEPAPSAAVFAAILEEGVTEADPLPSFLLRRQAQ